MILEHPLDKRKKYKYYRTDGNARMPQRFWSVELYTEKQYKELNNPAWLFSIEKSPTLTRLLNEFK